MSDDNRISDLEKMPHDIVNLSLLRLGSEDLVELVKTLRTQLAVQYHLDWVLFTPGVVMVTLYNSWGRSERENIWRLKCHIMMESAKWGTLFMGAVGHQKFEQKYFSGENITT